METKRRAEGRRNRKLKALKRKLMLTGFIIAVTCILCLQFGKVSSDAHGNPEEEPVSFQYYKSIEIQDGDTLWGIAEEYMNEQYYDCIQEYIAELKEINQLVTDDIQSANYLTVVYYDSEFKE